MSEKNQPIGTVECPHKGCKETCSVYRFRKRAGDDKLSRFAGKLYADCPKHGRIGADGKAATQEYLLSNAHIPTPKNGAGGEAPPAPPTARSSSGSPATSSAATSARTSSSSQSSTSSPTSAPKPRPWWSPVIE